MKSISTLGLLMIGLIGAACSASDDGGEDRKGEGGASSSAGGSLGSGGSVVMPGSGGSFNGGSVGASGSGSATGGSNGGNASGRGGRGSGASGESPSGGTPGSAGSKSSGGAPSSTGGMPSSTGGQTPVLPAVAGECPTFTTGTATIGGLSGISVQAGAKRDGTGSLLFYWHGTGSSAAEVNGLVPAKVRSEILDQGGIIVSFGGSLGTGGDCSGTGIFSKDDFKVADLIAACAVRDHGIDPRRIYTTGCSAGGLQAGCMGALRSSYIAATAPNSGGVVTKQPIQDAARTPAVMTMHGGSSDQVVVSFSQTSATYDAQMKTAGSYVMNCNHGGGHCGASAELYTAAWQFMKDHPFGTKPSPYVSAVPATFPSYCKNY